MDAVHVVTSGLARTRLAVMLGLAVGTASAVPVYLLGAVGPRLQAGLGMGDVQLGLALASFFGVSAVVSRWGGVVGDRHGWRVPAIAGCGLAAASLVGLGVWGDRFEHLLVALVVAGVGFGIAQPASNLVMLAVSSGEPTATWFGIKQAGIPAATLLSGIVLPVVAVRRGWEDAALVGGLAVVVVVIWAVVVGRGHVAERVHLPLRTDAERRPRLDPMLWGSGLAAALIASIPAFAVLAMVDAGFDEAFAGLWLALCSVAGIGCRVGAGWYVDRGTRDAVRVSGRLMQASAAAYLLLSLGSEVSTAAGVLVAFCTGWSWPGILFYGAVTEREGEAGRSSGRLQRSLSLGNTAGPAAFGLALATVGASTAWAVYAPLALVAGTLLARRSTRISPAVAQPRP